MTFLEATQELMARAISLDDVAHEVGVDILAIRRARLDPSNASYEKPPLNWQEAMARLARKRARSLEALADQWERAPDLARRPQCGAGDGRPTKSLEEYARRDSNSQPPDP